MIQTYGYELIDLTLQVFEEPRSTGEKDVPL